MGDKKKASSTRKKEKGKSQGKEGKRGYLMNRQIHRTKLEIEELFNIYYKLGERRSLTRLATATGISRSTLCLYSSQNKWQEQIKKRNERVMKRMNDKVEEDIAAYKAKMVREIDDYLEVNRELLDKIRDDLLKPDGGIIAENVADLVALQRGTERLTRLQLHLKGEPEGSTKIDGVDGFAGLARELARKAAERKNGKHKVPEELGQGAKKKPGNGRG